MGRLILCQIWPVVIWALIHFQNTTWYNKTMQKEMMMSLVHRVQNLFEFTQPDKNLSADSVLG